MKALVQKIPIKDIKVVGKHRPLVEKKLPVITDSLDKIGLKTPITVRKAKSDRRALGRNALRYSDL
jgi:hypothetical protein